MVRCRRVLTTAGCLLLLAGIAYGEPVADQSAASAPQPADEIWGDSEAAEESEPGWTWFGMGYERRNRGRTEHTAKPFATPDDSSGSGGNSRSSGR